MIDVIEVFKWLNALKPHKLDTPAKTLLEKLECNFRCNNYIQAHQVIKYLNAIADELSDELKKKEDAGQIWAEIGITLYQMGNLFEAEILWEKAKAAYAPASHGHAVIRGLLGAIQWKIETENINAVKNWKGAIREFVELADEAEKENHISDKMWYSERILEMEVALDKALSGKFP